MAGSLRTITDSNAIIKLLYTIYKELLNFLRSFLNDTNHARNIIYLWGSIYASSDSGMLFNALLLLDIISKIKTLGAVLSIFNENKVALTSTMALFAVLLYICAFISFQNFRDDFLHATPDMDDDDKPDFNTYCDTLVKCLVIVSQLGLRSGGGLGDVLDGRNIDDDKYYARYFFDFLFFMIINIILMNIFFGIIIDSFADKRAKGAEIEDEVQGQCFICGVSKSKFEIENVPWKDHIYEQHNLHGYMAFLIYVKDKDMCDCTGIEKLVKHSLEIGVISFFPINRCLAISGGDEIE
jgi:hypothetical protein